MTVFLGVVSIALFFGVVYLASTLIAERKPHCPRCNGVMEYHGEDESGREIWCCRKCGERVMI